MQTNVKNKIVKVQQTGNSINTNRYLAFIQPFYGQTANQMWSSQSDSYPIFKLEKQVIIRLIYYQDDSVDQSACVVHVNVTVYYLCHMCQNSYSAGVFWGIIHTMAEKSNQ